MLRDPLLHLLLIGLALYLTYEVLNQSPDTSEQSSQNQVAFTLEPISPQRIQAQLLQNSVLQNALKQSQPATTSGKPVTVDHAKTNASSSALSEQALIKAINDEILLQQAYRLGLNDDALIRERLINKAKFALEGKFVAPLISEEALQHFYNTHKAQYKETDTISFEQALIAPKHYPKAIELVNAPRESTVTDAQIAPLQQRAFISAHFNAANQSTIESLFGQQFLQQLLTSPINQWQGLVPSKHGKHLIKVTKITFKPSADFEAVRTAVQQDWIDQQKAQWFQAHMKNERDALGIDLQEYLPNATP